MKHDDIDNVFGFIEQLWPGKITTAHHTAMRPAITRLSIDEEQARAALGDLCCTFKGFLTPAHIVDRLRQVAFKNTPSDVVSRRSERHNTENQERREREALIEQERAERLAWINTLEQSDVDALVDWVREYQSFVYTAFLMKGRSGDNQPGISLAEARESRSISMVLWCANRRASVSFRGD